MPWLFQVVGVVLLTVALLLVISFVVGLALFSDSNLFRAIWHFGRRTSVDRGSVERNGYFGLDTSGWYLPSADRLPRRDDPDSSGEGQQP
jgi:hypothetical protein